MKFISMSTSRSARPFSGNIAAHVALVVSIAALGLLSGHGASAAEGTATPSESGTKAGSGSNEGKANATPTSGEDFTGDRLVLKSNAYDLTWRRDDSKGWIALQGTILRVTQDPTPGKGQGELLVLVVTVPCVVVPVTEKGATRLIARRDRVHLGVGALIDCPTDPAEINKLVRAGEVYRFPKEKLEEHGYFRSGWVYGALLVPYKYHFHDKSFTSATTIGSYLGYRMGGLGFETAFVASVGLSSLAVANPDGSGDTSTIQGFSFAIGVIGGVNKNSNPLRFGLLVGRDWAGSNSTVPYKHEGKAWAAVQIGFSFSE